MELKLNKELKDKDPSSELLIVPYGIETELETGLKPTQRAFNRTLWN